MDIYTYDDILALPDGVRAELIDGRIYYMTSPSTAHQRLITKLLFAIYRHIETHKRSCEVFTAPFAVFLNGDHSTYLEPDLVVICDKDKIKPDGCYGAPDWVIEILSPSSRSLDSNIKLFKYRTAGVREYWLVDSMKELVRVYHFHPDVEQQTYDEYSFSDSIPNGVYDDLLIQIQS